MLPTLHSLPLEEADARHPHVRSHGPSQGKMHKWVCFMPFQGLWKRSCPPRSVVILVIRCRPATATGKLLCIAAQVLGCRSSVLGLPHQGSIDDEGLPPSQEVVRVASPCRRRRAPLCGLKPAPHRAPLDRRTAPPDGRRRAGLPAELGREGPADVLGGGCTARERPEAWPQLLHSWAPLPCFSVCSRLSRLVLFGQAAPGLEPPFP